MKFVLITDAWTPQVNGVVAANPALHGAITGALVI